MALDSWVPICFDGKALEERRECLSDTVAEDEDANNPENDGEGPTDKKDAPVENQDRRFDTKHSEVVDHFC